MTHELASRKSLRLWPGVAAAILLIVGYIVTVVAPAAAGLAVPIGAAGALVVIIWWLFFSRAPWTERIGGIVVMAAAMIAMRPLTHMSIQNGMMGMMFVVYGLPTVALALVGWAIVSRRLSGASRWAALVVATLLGAGVWTILRTDGILAGGAQLAWRWTPTAEERLLAKPDEIAVAPAPAAAAPGNPPVAVPSTAAPAPLPVETTAAATTIAAPPAPPTRAEWPGFRGPQRDGVVRGVRINSNWSASPPVELWRRAIGPGWSSFAVSGDLLYTQEQRGEDEIVACYRVSTGEPVWRHRDPVRFWESNAGAGPRATPTLSGDRVYAFGATGLVNALDAATGRLLWSRNAATDASRVVPDWGFSSSPLVVGDVVIVAVSGSLMGYDAATGQPRWTGPKHGGSYSSPQLVTIAGVEQVVLLSGTGATSVSPVDGKVLWEHAWPGGAIVQPAQLQGGDVLVNSIGMTGGVGTRRLAVTNSASGWRAEERWTSNGLKPYFNDFVIHKDHAFGFDGSILACIDLSDGKRKWKGGRYGEGQLILLPDQDLLLVLSEEGELALVNATADQYTEVAKFGAIAGKTWNHPVLVGDVLLVRNGEEMAAFRLARAER